MHALKRKTPAQQSKVPAYLVVKRIKIVTFKIDELQYTVPQWVIRLRVQFIND